MESIETYQLNKNKMLELLEEFINIENDTSKELGVSAYGTASTKENFLVELPGKWIYSSFSIIGKRLAGYLIMSQWNYNIHGHRMAMASNLRSIKKVKIGQSLYRETKVNAQKHLIKYATANVPENNIATQKFYLHENFQRFTGVELSWFVEGRKMDVHIEGDILVDNVPVKGEPSRSFVFRYNYAN